MLLVKNGHLLVKKQAVGQKQAVVVANGSYLLKRVLVVVNNH